MTNRRTAIITGSTSGIGLGVTQALAASGVNVTLNGFGDAAEIEEVRSDTARRFSVELRYSPADMSKPADIARMVQEAEAALGPTDILINNAGIQFVAPIGEFPVEKWNAIVAVNLSSAFHTTQAIVSGMKARGFGRIINIASGHALVASPFKSAYVASKHGVAGLTKTTALELAAHGITVNAICPGYVWTPLVAKQIPDQAKTRGVSEEEAKLALLATQPTRGFVEIDEVSSLALYLVGDIARSITGTCISIDRGWTAQ
ncbi:3-hydroxybutyrate dehydrogenase [Aminobacter anthyllidis]|uniref:3-hydroxybutyrate dehydrogenase n=1 Tax=Aminobacter anthyllidis TaxID=1035067 RepID=A0A9X1D8X7_9HYPH|nr:3-hydroxybutyrate dehydrogenase [Aminobacter anthyllidis]MBT1159589.1 3-hydroxybutyrate dehydrogenase [Aminobacter anthyllidis]